MYLRIAILESFFYSFYGISLPFINIITITFKGITYCFSGVLFCKQTQQRYNSNQKQHLRKRLHTAHLKQQRQFSLLLPSSAPRALRGQRPRRGPERAAAALGLVSNSNSQQAAGRATPEVDGAFSPAAVTALGWGSRRTGGALSHACFS